MDGQISSGLADAPAADGERACRGRASRVTPPLGLYLHIPFCASICNYCNFNRGLHDPALVSRYVDALVREIACAGGASGRRAADTLYFGGGTPSLLEPAEIARLIRACEEAFELASDREVTLEANPETVTAERLAAYRASGVNRLSLGVQSFRDDELARLSRRHGAARAREAYQAARAAGFENVSLDLMMWLPGQRVEEWLASVDEARALRPEHLSLYLLEVYPNRPLRDEMARAGWSQAPDEDAVAMYLTAMARLDRSGYHQYEISNVARPARRARHNVKYWTDGEWLGFGCGAHSTLAGVRWMNLPETDRYVAAVEASTPTAVGVRTLTPQERIEEALFMALRMTDGIDLGAFAAEYGLDVWGRYGDRLEPFVEATLLEADGKTLRLTRRGMLLANEVMTVFV